MLQTEQFDTLENPSIAIPEGFFYGRKKTRLLVKTGTENIVLRLEDVVLIYTMDKLVYVIDQSSKKYISDRRLAELATELDKNFFFRANRQYILNINYIKSFKPHERVKLLIQIIIPGIVYETIGI